MVWVLPNCNQPQPTKGILASPVDQACHRNFAFATPDHFLQYTVMPFGMCNAPATFQRLINTVLNDVPNCNTYLDDLIVYSKCWEDHMITLSEVFD